MAAAGELNVPVSRLLLWRALVENVYAGQRLPYDHVSALFSYA